MKSYSLQRDGAENLVINAELIAEAEDEHQPAVRTPINTETLRLFRTDAGRWVLEQSFCFEGMEPHQHKLLEAENPAEILTAFRWPTPKLTAMLKAAATT